MEDEAGDAAFAVWAIEGPQGRAASSKLARRWLLKNFMNPL